MKKYIVLMLFPVFLITPCFFLSAHYFQRGPCLLSLSAILNCSSFSGQAEIDAVRRNSWPQLKIVTQSSLKGNNVISKGPLFRNILAPFKADGAFLKVAVIDDYIVDMPILNAERLEADPVN